MKPTESPSSSLVYNTQVIIGPRHYLKISIKLSDPCNNGHEDFAITADEWENGCNLAGGCLHGEILKYAPQFAPFVSLHLSDMEGSPMYGVVNGFYHFQQKAPFAQSYIRATKDQWAAIVSAQPRSEEEFSFLLESMGFRKQWQSEAKAAIRQLEKLTGKKFKSAARKRNWEPLAKDTVKLMKKRQREGYYTPEAIAKRDEETARLKTEKRIAELTKGRNKAVAKAETEYRIKLYFAERGLSENVIYHDHTNELCFNWSGDYSGKHFTQAEVDAIAADEAGKNYFPEGMKFTMGKRL